MAHRNPEHFRGESFEEQLEKAIEEHAKVVSSTREPKVFWKEPSAHDVMYQYDPIRKQKVFFPNGVPCEPGLGEVEPEDIADRVRRQIQGEQMARLAAELGAETFEEANDFQVEEGQDLCPYSGHEYSEQDEEQHNKSWAEHVAAQEKAEADRKLQLRRQEYLDMKAAFEPEVKSGESPSGSTSSSKAE